MYTMAEADGSVEVCARVTDVQLAMTVEVLISAGEHCCSNSPACVPTMLTSSGSGFSTSLWVHTPFLHLDQTKAMLEYFHYNL